MDDALTLPILLPDPDSRNVTSLTREQKEISCKVLAAYQDFIDRTINDKLQTDGLKARVVIGLRAQGHLPLIARMLKNGCDWSAIAVAIGWDNAESARLWYLAEKDDDPEEDE